MVALLVVGVAAGILTVSGGIIAGARRWNRRRRLRNWDYNNAYENIEEDYDQNYNH